MMDVVNVTLPTYHSLVEQTQAMTLCTPSLFSFLKLSSQKVWVSLTKIVSALADMTSVSQISLHAIGASPWYAKAHA